MNIFYLKRCFLVFAMAFLCLPFCFINAQTEENSTIEIENLPYNYSGTTCEMGDNHDDIFASYCSIEQYYHISSEDILFSFFPEETGCYSFSFSNISLTGIDSLSASLNIFDGNLYNPSTSCIDFTFGNSEINVNLKKNQHIFILLDSWYYCYDFDLNITFNPSNVTNNICSSAMPLEFENEIPMECTNYDATCDSNRGTPYYGNRTCSNDDTPWTRSENGVWYTFSHLGGQFDLSMQDIMCSDTLGSLQLGIWSNTGTCDLSQETFYTCSIVRHSININLDLPMGHYYLFVDGNFGSECTWQFIGTNTSLPECNCENENTPPMNDDCSNPFFLGELPTPSNVNINCPSSIDMINGDRIIVNSSNICATTSNLNNPMDNCINNDVQAELAADVWYSFVPTAPLVDIRVISQGNLLQKPRISLYEYDGNCDSLVQKSCFIGIGGAANLEKYGLMVGKTYYLQISGSHSDDQCDFSLQIKNSYDCDKPFVKAKMNLFNPSIANNAVSCGEIIQLCYTVFEMNSSFHNVIPIFGNGWDFPNSFVSLSAPNSCRGGGDWHWFNNVAGTNISGWFYDQGNDNNPTNNGADFEPVWGEQNCTWEFCFQISILPCDVISENAELSIEFQNYSYFGAIGSYNDYRNFYFETELVDCSPLNIILDGGGYICESEDNNVVLKPNLLSGGSELSFQWYNGENPIVGEVTDSLIVTATDSLNYYGVVVNNSCSIDTAYKKVQLVSRPELNPTFASSNCDHNNSGYINLGLGLDGDYTFNWNDNSIGNTGIALNLSNDIYNVTVINDYGCRIKETFDLSYLDLEIEMNFTDPSCNTNDVEIETTVIRGITPYSYLWNTEPPQTSTSISNVTTGTYIVTITDAVNCQIVDSITVIDKTTPTIIDIEQIGNNTTNSILLNPIIESEVAYYEWYFQTDWNSTAQLIGTSENIEIEQNGIYRLIASNQFQCSDIMEITIDSFEDCLYPTNRTETFDVNGPNTIRLSWNGNNEAASYEIAVRKVGGNAPWLFWTTTNTFRDFSGLNNGTYEWSVKANCENETSDWLLPAQQFIYNSAGKTNLPNPFDTENTTTLSHLNIYPNPATSQITLQYEQNIAEKEVQITIFDMLGKKILEQTKDANLGTNRIVIDISHMQKACYFVKIDNGEEQIIEKLMIF